MLNIQFFGFTFFGKKVKKEFLIKSIFKGDRAFNFTMCITSKKKAV